ncbi:hypothetical protein V1527DRAFT_455588 [Lipomyces starkeyi]
MHVEKFVNSNCQSLKGSMRAILEPKSYIWIGMSMLLNVGASVTNTFGPLILNGLYDKYTTSLLNMPYGAIQLLVARQLPRSESPCQG